MPVREGRRHATLRRPLDEARLKQERLVEVLERPLVLAEGVRERGEADGPAPEALDQNPVRCTPAIGSLSLSGTGNDSISYARLK